MRALRILPLLVVLLFLVYLGVSFVEANQTQVSLSLGSYQTKPTRLGFVVMSSVLVGIFIGAVLAAAQIFLLSLQNRALRKRVSKNSVGITTPKPFGSENDPGRDTFVP